MTLNFEYTYQIVECSKCEKEFLVERVLIGVDHTSAVIVTCKDCLASGKGLSEDFKRKEPSAAIRIEKWVKSSKSYNPSKR